MGQSASVSNPDDKVVLYQFARGAYVPSISPFCLKLETYLRLAKIDYVCDCSGTLSSKQKLPWIKYQGDDVVDSQFCIEYLNKKFGVDLDKNLSKEQAAISRSFLKMIEENFFWGEGLYRINYNTDEEYLNNELFYGFPWYFLYLKPLIKRRMYNAAWSQGMGRHSKEEVAHILELDLKAVSDYLGDKQYFMGDEPTEIDACLFGMFAQLLWATEPVAPYKIYMENKCPNLVNYCKRIKEKYWQDWNEVIGRPQTN